MKFLLGLVVALIAEFPTVEAADVVARIPLAIFVSSIPCFQSFVVRAEWSNKRNVGSKLKVATPLNVGDSTITMIDVEADQSRLHNHHESEVAKHFQAIDTPEGGHDHKVGAADPHHSDIQESIRRNKKSPSLETWITRLFTKEDPFGMHKIFGVGYMIASTSIMGAGATVGFESVPEDLELLTYILLISSIGQCVTTIPLAMKHRQGNIPARNVFFANAIGTVYSAYVGLWLAPFAPPVFDNQWVTSPLFAFFGVTGIVGVADSALRAGALVKTRKVKGEDNSFLVDYLSYIVPMLAGLPFFFLSLFHATHDHQWFLDSCLTHTHPFAPNVDLPLAYYAQVAVTMTTSYPSLLVTLRDKKLISKTVERGGIVAVCSVGAYFLARAVCLL